MKFRLKNIARKFGTHPNYSGAEVYVREREPEPFSTARNNFSSKAVALPQNGTSSSRIMSADLGFKILSNPQRAVFSHRSSDGLESDHGRRRASRTSRDVRSLGIFIIMSSFSLTLSAGVGAINRMNLYSCCFCFVAAIVLAGCATATKFSAARCYELRTYYAPPDKLDDLHARFRDHTMKLFAKHGIQNVGYWPPLDNSESKLVFLLAYPSREARESSWKSFMADPDWKAVVQKSEANGKIVTKVEQIFLQTTDYSPALKTDNISKGGVFELRTYTTPPGLLPNLDARFREHTMDLFAKHGMKNWIYFHKTPDQPAADTTLIYFLAHKSQDAAKASFDEFRKDPDWVAAKGASEANGSLTVKDGVKSLFLVPTDYSPTK
jgi:hypothetical protein